MKIKDVNYSISAVERIRNIEPIKKIIDNINNMKNNN
jgi:hypothetical protein